MKWTETVEAKAKEKKPKPVWSSFTCRIAPETLAKIDSIAEKIGVSRNRLINSALSEAAKYFEREKK